MKFAEDPVDRFKRLTVPPASSSALSPDALQRVMTENDSDETKLVDHVALNSPLTVAQAKSVVGTALRSESTPEATAKAISSAVSAAAISGGAELSDPVMLDPPVRLAFAIAFCIVIAGCIFCLDDLGRRSGTPSAALIGLTVVAGLAGLGVLVLVMGYKNVKITGKSGS
ncbi:hypothetical protein [Rudaeicoccus suwonensis]|uniref:Uncharacterized protein n=1 Tax=Rudaeicoccus suwonensis TaxID=657409 RepID=A0A561E429_9MICO|nr:hypothetical protein [Rudaeicoccus suwonensis]TWE10374.1 hypothetical protein BKA23_2734 [Rudaeicoccus suwonensis]